MGENDLTRLRCLEQDELFFSGSKDYPPANKVRVELNFKESTGPAAGPGDVERWTRSLLDQ
jgi:chromosome segregation protein